MNFKIAKCTINKSTHASNWSVTIYARFFERCDVLKDEISGYRRTPERGNMMYSSERSFNVVNNQPFEGDRTLLNMNGM